MNIQILDRLAVLWGERLAGELALDRNGAMQFAYAESWLRDPQALPISYSLPLQAEPFEGRACNPFFENLLPEEWQREAAARALGISSGNPFRLLKALGGDTAGALTLWPADQPVPFGPSANAPVPLDNAEFVDLFDRMARTPMLAGEGTRYSLAGAQSKLPVVLAHNRIALASPGQATTHIIKPEPERFPGLAANEAFCLTLAKSIGLNAAEAEWRSIGGRAFLLVSRYDRITESGTTRRLHQEDFAQALGVLSSKKYASDGGPVFRDCFDLVRRAATDPETEILKLIDAALFNLVTGNADAHAKNFSLLRKANGEVALAPLYDLVSTIVWPELSNRFAMKYGRARALEDMSTGSFERFAADAGVDFQIVRERGASLCERIMRSVEAGLETPGLTDRSAVSALAVLIHDRAGRVSLKLV
ncbi:type II toxin-antitoxin system HipA family toxin [Croceicoccus marinus]|uniref:Phosphatidylinositol kinase n=1 Tax=Croceicoccus marinus TaxID=450378 RepID=A0A1Z1FH02_9SPHN|nr:type II toxin-antitoxin system HipA family toxin [Croceicoccus marinus]ARU18081.1 phosphatidylinositol kinase [Croceicoccus marinus]QNE06804.1 type II toxin-antitoxin system HipA family toxin [Croceicoccus marinus]